MNAALLAILTAALMTGAGATVAVVANAGEGSLLSAMDSHAGHDHGAARPSLHRTEHERMSSGPDGNI